MGVTKAASDTATTPKLVVHGDAMVALLAEQAGMGFWRMMQGSGAIFWSDRVFEIYGVPIQSEPITLATFLKLVTEHDRPIVVQHMRRALTDRKTQKFIFRVNSGSGVKVIECTTGVIVDHREEVTEVFGSILDITARAGKDGNAAARSLLVRALMKNMPGAIAVFDNHMNYLAVSDFWVSNHYAASAFDLIGKNHYSIRPDLSAEHIAEHRRVLAGETVRSPRSYTKDRFGNPINQLCVMCPWHTVEGKIGGLIMMLGTVDLATAPTGDAITPEMPTHREFLEILKDIA